MPLYRKPVPVVEAVLLNAYDLIEIGLSPSTTERTYSEMVAEKEVEPVRKR
jgi:hypothetical protein